MSRRLVCRYLSLLAFVCPALPAQQDFPADGSRSAAHSHKEEPSGADVEILSDTNGVNIQPYMKEVMGLISHNWLSLIPLEAKPPESKRAEAQVRFTILTNGTIGAMHLDGSTHDDDFTRACWTAVARVGRFPRLPKGLESKPLELRLHFFVNRSND